LLALPTAEPDLIRHYTLSPADLAVIARHRRPHNRLGFAIQLCALRFPGRLLQPGEVAPNFAPLTKGTTDLGHFATRQGGHTTLRRQPPSPNGAARRRLGFDVQRIRRRESRPSSVVNWRALSARKH
jgi:hypothetical protein